MTPYLAVYFFLSIFSFFKNFKIPFFLIILVLIIFCGFRYNVGGDWYSYILLFDRVSPGILTNIKEPIFNILFYTASQYSYPFIILNIFCSIIFLSGMASYISIFENKIFNLTLAFPIYILIIGMGFVKQSLALGFIFYSLYFMHRNKQIVSIVILLIAPLLHVGSIIIVVCQLSYFLYTKKMVLNKIIYFIFFIFFIYLFYFHYSNIILFFFNHLVSYLDINKIIFTDTDIFGFFSRSLIVSFFCFLVINQALINNYQNIYGFYRLSSMVVILIIALGLFLSPVMSDRLLYFFAFIQIFFIGNIHLIIKNNKKLIFFKLISILCGFTILYIWLSFAHNSHAWLPYNNLLLL